MIRFHIGTIDPASRLEKVLSALLPADSRVISSLDECSLHGKRILFTCTADQYGPDDAFTRIVRCLRRSGNILSGSCACVLIDGEGELYTKDMARKLILAANLAGCSFPGKPLTEGTLSLHNFEVRKRNGGHATLWDAYRDAVREMVEKLLSFELHQENNTAPRIVMLHASDRSTSNTFALGEAILKSLPKKFQTETISLRNGTISDCRGCSYTVCSHFAKQDSCFYGGVITEDVFPAVLRSDVVLLLCPNYNDAVGANIMAFINRMTSLMVNDRLNGKKLFTVVVSGYSGSDIVAEQVLGALCLNKSFTIPGNYCLTVTANNPGEAMSQEGILDRIRQFSDNIAASV